MGELGLVCPDGGAGRPTRPGLGWRWSTPPDPSSLSEECLSVAEEAAQQVLNCIHPTLDSEEKRRDIVDYLQRLIKSHLNCEVFSYGSVPLKTYLPDGDIDLTAIEGPNVDDSKVHDVVALLHREEKNENAEFEVKDTQFVDAEVKLAKCLVQNIVIDISFNQLGGLSTLCFLEQVDRLVGKNHLFKRSIILIKAWCYYESRILGAHHGLISTYALETLILYIFHLFHSSICGPLSVLYRFLEYYSQFDWDNYCISLAGPVCKSSLPDLVVKMPESGWSGLMLSDEFLENCVEMFSVSSRAFEGKPKTFQTKHLNIIDPLKENNNLGRSVNIGNFYRIRSAFKYGSSKLGQVLSQPPYKVADGILEFFANTIARHGNDDRNSTQHLVPGFDNEDSLNVSLPSPVELLSENSMLLRSSVSDFCNDDIELVFKNDMELSSEMESGCCYSSEEVVLGHHIATDSCNLATSSSSLQNGASDDASSINFSSSLSSKICQESLFLSSKSSAEIERLETRDFQSYLMENGFKSWLEEGKELGEMKSTNQWCMKNLQAVRAAGLGSVSEANNVDNASPDFRDSDLTSLGGESEAFNPLADLSGDYDSQIRSLLYGQLCHGFSLSASGVHHLPSSPFRSANKKPWNIVRESLPFWQSHISQMSFQPTKMSTEQTKCMAADSASPSSTLCFEGTRKARGIGTFFPHVNGFYRGRHSQGRSRNLVSNGHNQFHRDGRSYGSYHSSCPKNSLENGVHGTVPAKDKSQGQLRSDAQCQSPRSVGNGYQTNGKLRESCRIEFGSIGNLADEFSASVDIRGSTPCASPEKKVRTAVAKQERVQGQSIHLKNEVEFPPLSY